MLLAVVSKASYSLKYFPPEFFSGFCGQKYRSMESFAVLFLLMYAGNSNAGGLTANKVGPAGGLATVGATIAG